MTTKNTTKTTAQRAKEAGAKTPDDHKEKEGEKKLPDFTHDGVTYTATKSVEEAVDNFGVARRASKGGLEGMFALAESMFDDDALAVLDTMNFAQIDEVLTPIFQGISSGN